MNKLLHILTWLLLATCLTVEAQTVKEWSVHYELDDFDILRHDDVVYVLPKLLEEKPELYMAYFQQPGMPALPCMLHALGVLQNSAKILLATPKVSNRILVAKNVDIGIQWNVRKNGEPWPIFEMDSNFPVEEEKFKVTLKWGDLSVWLYPFEYDASTRSLYFTPDFSIRLIIQNGGKDEKMIEDFQYHHERWFGQEEEESENPLISPMSLNKDYEFIEDSSNLPLVDYLIITSEALKEEYAPLLDWKKKKGLKTKLVTVESINTTSRYAASTVNERIKNCIAYHHNTYATSYVLLGGDASIIPVITCDVKVNSSDIPAVPQPIPTDQYYACFQGQYNWDRNGNGKYGEAVDSVNLRADVLLSRVPLDTKASVKAYVNKLLAYEKEAKVERPTDILFAGSLLIDTVKGKGISDAQNIAQYIYGTFMGKLWEGQAKFVFDSIPELKKKINGDYLATEISKGYGFVDIQSHGETNAWLLSGGKYSPLTSTSIINPGSTIITTNACHVNAFDKGSVSGGNPCLSQFLISQPNNGVIGFWGSSRQGLGTSDVNSPNPLGPSQDFEAHFYYNLAKPNSNKNFGRMVTLAKERWRRSADTPNTPYRWLYFSMNPIGDPEVPLYTTTPKTIDNVKVTELDTGGIRIELGLDSCVVCLTGIRAQKEFQYIYRNKKTITIPSLYTNPTLVITKQNYKPLIAEGKEKILQIGNGRNGTIELVFLQRGGTNMDVTTNRNESPNSTAYLTLTDVMGNIKIHNVCNNNENATTLDVSSVPEGIYILTLYIDGCPTDSRRIVKQ